MSKIYGPKKCEADFTAEIIKCGEFCSISLKKWDYSCSGNKYFPCLYCDTLQTAHGNLFFQMHISFRRFSRNIHSFRNVYAGRWHAVHYQIRVKMLEITGFSDHSLD